MTDPRITDEDRAHWALADDDLRTFEALDPDARHIILALLGAFGPPKAADHEALNAHPNAQALVSWLMQLPPYRRLRESGYEDED